VHISILLKLFIALLLTTLLIVAGMHLFMRQSLNRGFTEFIEARQQERIDLLISRLVENYAISESWKPLATSKRQWIKILRSDAPRRKRAMKWMKKSENEPINRWPPISSEQERNKHSAPLNLRIMLLNADKLTIFGRQEDVSLLTLQPIFYKQKIIGYLGLLPGHPIKQLGDKQFMEQQAKAYLWITFLMIALSASLALLLAYLFGRPLKKITVATQALGMGEYAMRLPITSNDELGQLARDFNEMAAALQQSEQARQRWVADVSHELRTPLAILNGELEALQDGIRPMNIDAIHSLSSEVSRLTRLTNDLYQLALSDHGALTYRKIKLNPIALLKQNIAGLKPKFDHKQITVTLFDKSHNIRLFADPDRLTQLFQNLLTNSAKYTDNGGHLDITLSQKNKTLFIDLSDSAPSVPQQKLEKLFNRLYRVEKSRSRNLGGAGLGLSICKNIITAHHGKMSAHPSILGGLAIHIELPITP